MFKKARSFQNESLSALEFNHAHCLSQLGRVEDARAGFQALRDDPDVGIRSLWAELSSIAVVVQHAAQVNEERERFLECLDRIERVMEQEWARCGFRAFRSHLAKFSSPLSSGCGATDPRAVRRIGGSSGTLISGKLITVESVSVNAN